MARDHIARRALAQRDLTLVEVGGDVVGSFDRLDQAALAVGHEQADRGVKLCGADSADVTERGRACVVRGLCSYRSPDSSRTVVDHRGSAKGGVLGTKRRWRAQVHKTSVGDISGVTACC